MKRDSFNVLFYLKKAKLLKSGEASVCMRWKIQCKLPPKTKRFCPLVLK